MSYSNKTRVILIKNKIRTTDIELIRWDEPTSTYHVIFKHDKKENEAELYQYAKADVKIFQNPIILNPAETQIFHKDKDNPLENIYVICGFYEEQGVNKRKRYKKVQYYTIGFNDSRKDIVCPAQELSITPKANHTRFPSSDVLEYLQKMAYLHGYDIRLKDEQCILGEQFRFLRQRDFSESLLDGYLKGCLPRMFQPSEDKMFYYPFYTNSSQMVAMDKAFSQRLSVIQGPPGTGKTETILNILINLVLRGKTVMVVAGSNAATDNILEKLKEAELDFLVAKLGRKTHKEAFVKSQLTSDFLPKSWRKYTRNPDYLRGQIRKLVSELKGLFGLDVRMHQAIEKGDKQTETHCRIFLDNARYQDKRMELKEASMNYVRMSMMDRFEGYRRRKYKVEDVGIDSTCFEAFLKDYPIVLSTAFSASQCISNDVPYDYLIMDEASQVSVVTGALALSVARNAVIVGDTKQLSNVVPNDIAKVSSAIFGFSHISQAYNYATHSVLESILNLFTGISPTLLREHYRCHPKIARFFNQEFYDGRLVTMTEDRGEENVLLLRTTVPGNHASGFVNHREEEELEEWLKTTGWKTREEQDVGIIAPYKSQVERVSNDEDIDDDIVVSTVHKFQGKQKPIIIISTVDNIDSDFVNDPQMLNVAVSRAQRQLVLVTNGNDNPDGPIQHLREYIYRNGHHEHGKIHSLFDLIYTLGDGEHSPEYDRYVNSHSPIPTGSYHANVPPTPAERIAWCFISDILKEMPELALRFRYPLKALISGRSLPLGQKELDERDKQYVKNAHIDIVVFQNRTMEPVLAIEVDGYSYHKNGTIQDGRDELKDDILKRYGIHLERLNTKKSINEMEEVKQKIIDYGRRKKL